MRVQEIPSNNQNLYSYVPVPPPATAVNVTDVPGPGVCGLAGDGGGVNSTAVAGATGVGGALSV